MFIKYLYGTLERIEKILENLSRIPAYCKIILIAVFLGVMFSPGIYEYLHIIFDSHYFYRDDTIYLPPFYKYLPNPTPSEYIKDYYLNALIPYGFKAIMAFIYTHLDTHLWVGLIKLCNLVFAVVLVGIVAWELGGSITCFASIALFLYSPLFYYLGMNGLTPRIVVYPFMVLSVLFMVKKRIYALAALVIIAALIYPQSAFMLGTIVAIWLLLIPKKNVIAVNHLGFYKKILLLATTAFIALAIIIPQIMSVSDYGRRMTAADIPAYPEIGAGGSYTPLDSLPYAFFARDVMAIEVNMFVINNIFIFIIISFGILYAIGSNIETIYKQNQKCTAVFVLIVSGLVTHTLAYIFSPYLYLPSRYLAYTIPLFFIFIAPLAIDKLLKKCFKNQKLLPSIITALYIGIYSLTGTQSMTTSLDRQPDYNLKTYAFIKTLPQDVLIAGWPKGIIYSIPLITHKNALLTSKTHDVLSKNYLEEMRRRAYAIIDVYFATSLDPLVQLRDDFKVTHFIVDKGYFSGQKNLAYSLPFEDTIKNKLETMKINDGILMSDKIKNSVIFEDHYYKIIDLKKL